jgi:hypothetical protein
MVETEVVTMAYAGIREFGAGLETLGGGGLIEV